jgi:hypothetical protein
LSYTKIDEYTNTKNNNIRIPKKANGNEFKLEDLNEGQFNIAYIILKNQRMASYSHSNHTTKKEIHITMNYKNGMWWNRKECVHKYTSILHLKNIQ